MIKRIDYSGLRTIADVRRERTRVQRDIMNTQAGLEHDYSRFAVMFSLDYWVDFIAGKVQNFVPAIQAIYSGYRMVSSIFGKHRRDHEEETTTTRKTKTTTTKTRKKKEPED